MMKFEFLYVPPFFITLFNCGGWLQLLTSTTEYFFYSFWTNCRQKWKNRLKEYILRELGHLDFRWVRKYEQKHFCKCNVSWMRSKWTQGSHCSKVFSLHAILRHNFQRAASDKPDQATDHCNSARRYCFICLCF